MNLLENEPKAEDNMSFRRYERQMLLPGFGMAGQKVLADSSILVVGVGALGSLQAEWLARAGVGHLRLVDFDRPSISNLHRQVMYTHESVDSAQSKVAIAAARLAVVNPGVNVDVWDGIFDDASSSRLLQGVDVVLDATDNFRARFALNRACLMARKPWVYGGVSATSGVVLPIVPGMTPCLQCLLPREPGPDEIPGTDVTGVLGPAAGAVASIQAAQALRLLLKQWDGRPGASRLVSVDVWSLQVSSMEVLRTDLCPACGLVSTTTGC